MLIWLRRTLSSDIGSPSWPERQYVETGASQPIGRESLDQRRNGSQPITQFAWIAFVFVAPICERMHGVPKRRVACVHRARRALRTGETVRTLVAHDLIFLHASHAFAALATGAADTDLATEPWLNGADIHRRRLVPIEHHH